jgi:hypothetical protein
MTSPFLGSKPFLWGMDLAAPNGDYACEVGWRKVQGRWVVESVRVLDPEKPANPPAPPHTEGD